MNRQEKTNLHCFQEDSHASRSQSLEQRRDLRTPVISGRKCAVLLRNCGPITCLAKMLLTSSIWGSTKRFLTWKRRDTKCGHSYFLLVPSARGMSESELSSWGLMLPTPLASDTGTRAAVSRVGVTPRGAFYGKRRNRDKRSALLSEVIYFLDQEAPADLRINPEWVEWMMGFPKGWTESPSGT